MADVYTFLANWLKWAEDDERESLEVYHGK